METGTALFSNPWENRHQLGTANALMQAVKQSLLAPMEFFAGTPATGGLESPLWYGAILLTIGTALGQLWSVLWNVGVTAFSAAASHGAPESLVQGGIGVGMGLVMIVLSPLFAIIGLFITSGLTHLALLILGGNRNGFEATFRAIAYAQGPMLLSIVPIIGPAVGGLWALVLEILALMRLQQIEGWRATVAVLLFPCTCTLLIIAVAVALVVFIGVGVGAAAGQGGFGHFLQNVF